VKIRKQTVLHALPPKPSPKLNFPELRRGLGTQRSLPVFMEIFSLSIVKASGISNNSRNLSYPEIDI
jgi:hypothetical protein